jgi:hypothetical protein
MVEEVMEGVIPTPNGLLVARRDGWDILVLPMMVNWRVLLSRTGDDYNVVAAFCFQGRSTVTRDRAITEARAWAEGDVLETDPEGYVKVAFDGREHDYWNRR